MKTTKSMYQFFQGFQLLFIIINFAYQINLHYNRSSPSNNEDYVESSGNS